MEAFLKPMLCGKADLVPEGDEWVAEPKFDGWRAVAHADGVGVGGLGISGVRLFCGRNAAEYSGKLPYIEDALHAVLPRDSAVDGELLGGGWGDVQGVMTRGDGPHVPSAHVPALTYVLFDITRLAGEDLRHEPWQRRRAILAQALANAPEPLLLAPVGPSNAGALTAMLDLGMEGVVCKRTNGRYVNSRSNLWIKVKPQDTEDGELIGFYEPTPGSKYEGNSVGGLRFRLASGFEGKAAGMNDQLRREMYAHPERFIGRTVELRHHGVQKGTGALRHPQFFRFRDDVDGPPAKPKAAPRVERRPAGGGGSGRNYGAMGDAKLLKSIEQLRAKSGDAYERCLAKDADPDVDLGIALAAADSKGLL